MLYVYVVTGSEDGVVEGTTSRTKAMAKVLDYINVLPNSELAADVVKGAERDFRSLVRDQKMTSGTLFFEAHDNSGLTAEIEFFAQGYD